MASIHTDPRGKSPFWYCAYSLPDGRRVFRSTKQRDRKNALAICLKLSDAVQAAKAGEFTEIAARKNLDDILKSAENLHIRQFWGRLIAKDAGVHVENFYAGCSSHYRLQIGVSAD